jgi:hypothetical protein
VDVFPAVVVSLVTDKPTTNKRKHNMWNRKWYFKRNITCDAHLLNELPKTDFEDYINYLRMNEQTFNMLLTKVVALLSKKEHTLEGGNLTKMESYCYTVILSNRQ